MAMFARILSAAALAGVLSGLLLTALQQIAIAPLLREAEAREVAAAAKAAHDSAPIQPAHAAWTPQGKFERVGATALANVLLATGFGLLLGAAMSARGHSGWRHGLLWGAAGFAAFFVAPSLGLPPELPGAEAAPLRERTMWWMATVTATAAGLWLVVFGRKPVARALGLVLVVAPHAMGAPTPAIPGGFDSTGAADDFVRATYVVNAALWATLGGLVGLFYKMGPRRSLSDDRPPAPE